MPYDNTGDAARLTELFTLLRVRDAEAVARKLLDRYLSLPVLLGVSVPTLTEFGLTHDQALLLNSLSAVARHARRDEIDYSLKIDRFSRAAACVRALYPGLRHEQITLLCLNKDRSLLAIRALNDGTVREVAVTMNAVMRALIETEAQAVVFCHNHPNGTAAFSEADISATKAVLSLLGALGIPLFDHLLYANGQIVSMRAVGALPEAEWRFAGADFIPRSEWLFAESNP